MCVSGYPNPSYIFGPNPKFFFQSLAKKIEFRKKHGYFSQVKLP